MTYALRVGGITILVNFRGYFFLFELLSYLFWPYHCVRSFTILGRLMSACCLRGNEVGVIEKTEDRIPSPFMYPQQNNAARLPAHFYLAALPPTLHQYFPISSLVFLLLYLHNFDIPHYFCFQLQQLHLPAISTNVLRIRANVRVSAMEPHIVLVICSQGTRSGGPPARDGLHWCTSANTVIPINLDCIHFNFTKRRRLSATLNGFQQADKISDSWWFPVVPKVSESCRFSLHAQSQWISPVFTVFFASP
jgi:hypothetical protein